MCRKRLTSTHRNVMQYKLFHAIPFLLYESFKGNVNDLENNFKATGWNEYTSY